MTRDNIIRMAREAGISDTYFDFQMVSPDDLERFAALIAAAEREEFLKWCEASSEGIAPRTDWAKGYVMAIKNVAEGFRARGNQ